MNTVTVKKRFELKGRDVDEVGRRIQQLGEAVRTRGGKLVEVAWASAMGQKEPTLSVTYQIPVLSGALPRVAARTPIFRS